MEDKTYTELVADWRLRHKRTLVRKQTVSSWGLIFKIALWVGIAIAAAVVSSSHTIPAALQTIPKEVISPFREISAVMVFGILEFAIFAAAVERYENKAAAAMLVCSIVAALLGNLSSSVAAVLANDGDLIGLVMAVVMSFLAPLSAFLAGEMAHKHYLAHRAAVDALNADYEAKVKDEQAAMNRDISRLMRPGRENHSRHSHENENENERISSVGFSRQSKARDMAWEYFEMHPEALQQDGREVAHEIGISPASLYRARAEWMNNHNGHH